MQSFYKIPNNNDLSFAEKVLKFLEDFPLEPEYERERKIMTDSASWMRDAAALTHGSMDDEDRRRRFQGFNSPFLPEILVMTSVGQEGINLHRFCREAVHYDLRFNPADLEQRTGRIDRVGGKVFCNPGSVLEVDIPYVAATYDEKIFNDVRSRAQIFEILMGGNLASDTSKPEEDMTAKRSEISLVSLPSQMVQDLRVELGCYTLENGETGPQRSKDNLPIFRKDVPGK